MVASAVPCGSGQLTWRSRLQVPVKLMDGATKLYGGALAAVSTVMSFAPMNAPVGSAPLSAMMTTSFSLLALPVTVNVWLPLPELAVSFVIMTNDIESGPPTPVWMVPSTVQPEHTQSTSVTASIMQNAIRRSPDCPGSTTTALAVPVPELVPRTAAAMVKPGLGC